MRAMYVWIALLTLIGLSLAYFLIPSEEEIALIEWKGGKFAEGAEYFKKQYEKGMRTPSILIQLSRIAESEGDVDAAIAFLEEFLKEHPNDVFVLKKIGDLFVASQQYDSFFQILLKLKTLHANSDVLQELATWYKNANDAAHLFSILAELVAKGKGEASNYFDLAYFYAQKKEYQKAYQTMEIMRKQFPKEISINDIFFEIWVVLRK